MTTTTLRHCTRIQAPASLVFKYLEDPATCAALYPDKVTVTDIDYTPQGIGTTYRWGVGFLGLQLSVTMTREDQVVDSRIVERSSSGPVWTWTLTPDHDSTEVALEMSLHETVPLLDKAIMATVGRHTDEEMIGWLEAIKKEIEV